MSTEPMTAEYLDECEQHIRACNKIAQTGPENLRRMLEFVLATIQQQLETTPEILATFTELGKASKFAFGSKADGLDYLADDTLTDRLYDDAMAARDSDNGLMSVFMRVPGLGLVKAGFACQLFAGRVGCLDTHNIKLYDIPLSTLRYSKNAKPETLAKHISDYVNQCAAIGTPVYLWAAWCDFVARKRPLNWDNGEDVSQFHVESLLREWSARAFFDSQLSFDPEYKRNGEDS